MDDICHVWYCHMAQSPCELTSLVQIKTATQIPAIVINKAPPKKDARRIQIINLRFFNNPLAFVQK